VAEKLDVEFTRFSGSWAEFNSIAGGAQARDSLPRYHQIEAL
jgi:hypothetical protein